MGVFNMKFNSGFLASAPKDGSQDVALPSTGFQKGHRNRKDANQVLRVAAGTAVAWLVSGVAYAAPFDGEWKGDMQCGPSQNTPVKAPTFTNPLTMVVTGRSATVIRDTEIVMETYAGQVSGAGQATFTGTGRYKDPAKQVTWTAKIDGRFSGGAFSGSAEIIAKTGQTLRECSVEFAKVAPATPSTKQKDTPAVVAPNPKPMPSVVPATSPPVPPKTQVPVAVIPDGGSTRPAETPTAAPTVSPAPTAPVAIPPAPVAQPSRTLTGTMHWGKTDSCLEVQYGQKSKCYGFVAQSAVEKSLLVTGACLQGEECSVTGVFDDEKELLVTVTTAVALEKAMVSPSVQQQPAATVPVASVPAAEPVAEAAQTKGNSRWGIGLTIAGLGALLVAIVLFARRGKGSKEADPKQIAMPKSTRPVVLTPSSPPPALTKVSEPPPVALAPVASDLTYQVILNGVRPGHSMSDSQQQLAALFKATAQQMTVLLATPGNVVKKGVGLDVATKYKSAIEAAGGVCEIVPDEAAITSLDVDLPQLEPSMPEVRTANSYASTAPPTGKPPTSAPQGPTASPATVALWNPKAAVSWSFLLTPAFGSYLQMLNWQSLGEPEKAASARKWFYGSFGMLAVSGLLPLLLRSHNAVTAVSIGLAYGYYFAWLYMTGLVQVAFVHAEFGADYPRRKWWKPMFVWFIVALTVGSVMAFVEDLAAIIRQ